MYPSTFKALCVAAIMLLSFQPGSATQAATVSASAKASENPPNILLIYVDDLGYGDLGSYGHGQIKTPHLDQLAREGVRLTNYYAPSALCSPSRAGLLTGRHPYRTGIDSWIPANSGKYLAQEEITLAELLKSAGYHNALIGKWHLNSNLGSAEEPQPQDQGFDYFYGHNAFQIPTNKNPTNLYRNRQALPAQTGYTADLYVDDAIRWLRLRKEAANKQPFFLMLSMAEPHTSIENPANWNARYRRFTQGTISPIESGLQAPPKSDLIPRGPGEYYANVSYMDYQIGRVLKTIKKLRLDQNTLILFASDNGPVTSQWINWWEVNAYGSTGGLRGRKHMIFEGGIKVPAIVKYPGHVKPGSESAELIVGTDFYTTLARFAHIDIPQDRSIDGIDVSAAFTGATLPPRNLLWALEGQDAPPFAWREANWKLVLDANHSVKALFDLTSDPLELFDLSNSETHRTIEMRRRFLEALSELKSDPLRRLAGQGPPKSKQ